MNTVCEMKTMRDIRTKDEALHPRRLSLSVQAYLDIEKVRANPPAAAPIRPARPAAIPEPAAKDEAASDYETERGFDLAFLD